MKTEMTLADAISHSGDSEFISLSYDGETLSVKIDMDELDREIVLIVKTKSLESEMPFEKDRVFRTCRIAFERLGDSVACLNGYFVPPQDFGILMKDVRGGRSLAYGKRVSEHAGILSIIGHSRLISCFVASENDIWIQEV